MADPLDALRQPETPVAPSRAFRAQLRRRLADLLDPTPPGGPVSITEPAVRSGLRLRPYLVVDGADAAIAFYADVFGARVIGDLFRGDDGRIGHCVLDIAGNELYLADAYPELGIPAPDPAVGVALHLEVTDADVTVDRATASGATVLEAVGDRFYGSRSGTIQDPFGHRWQIDAPGGPMDEAAMTDSGYAFETVDLGDRAAGPATSSEAPGLGYFTINAPDGPKAAAFYGALLGWQTEQAEHGYHVANISPPGGIDATADEPGVSIFLRVDDVSIAVARVRELGGTVLSEAVHPSGGNASCLDDQGIPFQLWQPAPGY